MNKILGFIVVATVSVFLLALVVVPVIGDSANKVSATEYNGGSDYTVRMSYGTPTDNLYFVKPADAMYVNCYLGDDNYAADEPYYVVPLNSVGQMGWILCSSSISLGITGYGPEPMDTTSVYNNQGAGGYNTVANTKTVKLNASTGKVVTWTTDPNSTWNYYDTVDLDHVFWADPNGDYVNVQVPGKYAKDYIEDPKAIAGSSMTEGNYIFYYDTDHVSTTASKDATVSTETTEYRGLYELTSVPMDITGLDDSDNAVHSAHVIIKYKVQGDATPGSDGYLNVIWTIPVIIILALIMGAAYVLYHGRE